MPKHVAHKKHPLRTEAHGVYDECKEYRHIRILICLRQGWGHKEEVVWILRLGRGGRYCIREDMQSWLRCDNTYEASDDRNSEVPAVATAVVPTPAQITLPLQHSYRNQTANKEWSSVVYYHWASFANLTSFANFIAVAANLETFPQVKLWYFFNMLKNVCLILLQF